MDFWNEKEWRKKPFLEREWEPICRNEEEDEQFKRPSNSACRMSDPVGWKLTRKQEAWIWLAGFLKRLAGFEKHYKFDFSDYLELEIRFCSTKLPCEFSFPVLLTGRPVVRQWVPSKFGLPDWRTDRPVMKQRGGLANSVFWIENPVFRMLSREQSKLIRLSGICPERNQ